LWGPEDPREQWNRGSLLIPNSGGDTRRTSIKTWLQTLQSHVEGVTEDDRTIADATRALGHATLEKVVARIDKTLDEIDAHVKACVDGVLKAAHNKARHMQIFMSVFKKFKAMVKASLIKVPEGLMDDLGFTLDDDDAVAA
jgi:hypothetical protein